MRPLQKYFPDPSKGMLVPAGAGDIPYPVLAGLVKLLPDPRMGTFLPGGDPPFGVIWPPAMKKERSAD